MKDAKVVKRYLQSLINGIDAGYDIILESIESIEDDEQTDSIKIDPDILHWFESRNINCQNLVNDILREYINKFELYVERYIEKE